MSVLSPRDTNEGHRVATPLELLVDLAFVVAVAQASTSFQHLATDGHPGAALGYFMTAFFAIWWAWMNFTWFASAYDNDDVVYRLATFVQIIGVLILAAGVPRAFKGADLGVLTVGYVVMRLAMILQWLRAARSDPPRRPTALRYAAGITVAQAGWIGRLWLPNGLTFVSIGVLIILELSIPIWAESVGRTTWHPNHIAERYGGFTIIVLGESVLSATIGVQRALDGSNSIGDITTAIAGGLLILFAMWWLYFSVPGELATARARVSFEDSTKLAFLWGYGHYFVFACAALTGAGLAAAIDQIPNHPNGAPLSTALAVTVPAAVYVIVLWALHLRWNSASFLNSIAPPVAATVIAATSFTPEPILLTGITLTCLVTIGTIGLGNAHRADRSDRNDGHADQSGDAPSSEPRGQRVDRRRPGAQG